MSHVVPPPEILEDMMNGDSRVRTRAVRAYDRLDGRDWSELYGLARRHPNDFAAARVRHADGTLLQTLWDATEEAKVRKNTLISLFNSASFDKNETDTEVEKERAASVLDLLKNWFDEQPKAVTGVYEAEYSINLHSRPPETLARLWDLDIASLRWWVSDGLFCQLHEYVYHKEKNDFTHTHLKEGDGEALLALWKRFLPERAYDFYHWAKGRFENKDIEDLLRIVPREMEHHLLPALKDLVESKSSSYLTYRKTLREIVVEFLSRLPPEELDEDGFFDSESTKTRALGIEALIAREDSAAARTMVVLCRRETTEDVEKGILLDRLEELGEDVSELDEDRGLSAEDWQDLATKARPGVIPKELRDTAPIELLAPFGEKFTRFFISIASKVKEGRVPRRARHMLRCLPEEAPVALAQRFFDFWLGIDGRVKLSWTLNFASEYGDDRYVLPLKKAINKWSRHAKPRANLSIRVLGRLGTTYALSVLDEIAGSGKYSESLVANARKGLDSACRRRGVGRDELAEELIPDFGITKEGLVLDLGPRKVAVTIDSELNLRVNHETGKTTKSFPTCKKDEDTAKHKEAKDRFDILRKNLKPVVKRQRERMEERLVTGSFYDASRWKRIYRNHALLSRLMRGVIWARMSQRFDLLGSFRVSEDGSLIDAYQDPVVVSDDDLIGVWHPVVSDENGRHAWTQHFGDYQLIDVLGQLERRVYELTAKEAKSSRITRFDGQTFPSIYMKGRFRSLGFQPLIGDRARIYAHVRIYDAAGLTVRIDHSDVEMHFEEGEEVALNGTTVVVSAKYRKRHGLREKGDMTLGELPPALVCCLMETLERLVELGKPTR